MDTTCTSVSEHLKARRQKIVQWEDYVILGMLHYPFFDLQHGSIDGDIGVSCCHTWLFKPQDNCNGLQIISIISTISCILIPCSITQWSFLHQKSVLSQSDSVELDVLWFMSSDKPHHSPTTPKHIKNKHVSQSNRQIRLYISVKCSPPYSFSWTAPYVKEN
jgi:hypothetical protein